MNAATRHHLLGLTVFVTIVFPVLLPSLTFVHPEAKLLKTAQT